ncbi:MAG TPA: outer membrane protein transport protein, partial [Thermoanaerobaculia bacterium]|nr:outer membrane protein transport protein [Thermoanaerobaculia bacterium]
GTSRLTQESTGNPLLDAVIATQAPFGQALDVRTQIKFPDQLGFGMKFVVTPNVLVETDVERMGWSSFKQLNVHFTGGQLPDLSFTEKWKDVYSYRVGVKWDTSATGEWRFGYVYDKTPQPTLSMGPLLPGADRTGYSIGYGIKGTSLNTDLAVMYLPFKKRTTMDNIDHFYGTYQTTAWLFGATFSW